MARIKNTDVYVFDTVPEVSSFLVGSDQGDGRITKSYRIDALFGLAETEGFIKEAPIDGQPYLRQDGDWELVPASGVGSVFSVFGRTGAVTGLVGDYSAFYALTSHTHLQADITDANDTNWDTAYSWGDHSGLYVDLISNQYTIGGEKTFTGAVQLLNGRVGVQTPVFGGSRLGDSDFQAGTIDVEGLNFKNAGSPDDTGMAIFVTPVGGSDGYTASFKNFVDDVFVFNIAGKGVADYTDSLREVETTFGLRNDYTAGQFTVYDTFNQDYPSGVAPEVRQKQGAVAIHGGGATAKPIGLWRYDTTTYTNIWELDSSDVWTFGVDINVPTEAYTVAWSGSTEVPTKGDIYTQLQSGVLSVFGRTGAVVADAGDYSGIYALSSHTHLKADITDFSVDIADINATGTPSASTWLRGDGTWGTILGGVSSVFGRTAAVVATAGDYDAFYYTEAEMDASLALYLPLAGGTLTGNLTISKVTPEINLYHTGGAADEKNWDIVITGNDFRIRALDDALALAATPLQFARTAGTITDIDLIADDINLTGIVKVDAASGDAIRILGTGAGTANIAYLTFNDNAAARQGYVGVPSASNGNVVLYNDTSASYIGLLEAGGDDDLVYFYGGGTDVIAHTGNIPATGDWFDHHPMVLSSGVMEIGRYIDFHTTDVTTDDFTTRLDAVTDNTLRMTTVSASTRQFEVYLSSVEFARMGANASGGFLTLSDDVLTDTIIRGYGESDFYGGDINVNNNFGVTAQFFARNTTTGIQDATTWDSSGGAVDAHALFTTSNTTASTGYPTVTGQTFWVKGASDARSFAWFNSATSTNPHNSFYVGHMDLVGGWDWAKDLNEFTYTAEITAPTAQNLNWHFSSEKDCIITIEADTLNEAGETNNPVLHFIQDGNLVSSYIALEGPSGTLATGTTSNYMVQRSSHGFDWIVGTTHEMVLDTTGLTITDALTVDGHQMQNSSDRDGLLEILGPSGKAWYGIQIKDDAGQLWSLMGNANDFGMYDDTNSKFALNYNKNSTLVMYYNGSARITTTSAGMTLTGTGTGTDWVATSDKTLKKNIKPLGDYKITTNWKKFNWKDSGDFAIGLIAQDLEKTNPEFVTLDPETGKKGVSYTQVLVAKMAEKDKEISELKEAQRLMQDKLDLIIKKLL